jgi:type III secretion protein J
MMRPAYPSMKSNRLTIPAPALLRNLAQWLMRASIFLLLGTLCACTETVNLQTGLNDADANEIVSLLNRNGIDSQKHTTKEGVSLTVKESNISRATEVMRAAGLPKRSLSDLGQMFKKEGMISTPLEERVRYIHGLSQELEYTLQQFDNVVSARVHVVLPERIAPGEPIQPSSAAVFVKYHPPFDEDTAVPRIRNLVASSIPGLSGDDAHDKVSVVLVPSERTAPGVQWTYVGPFSVQAGSATALTATLVGMALFAALSAGLAVFIFIKRPTGTPKWLKKKAKPSAAMPVLKTAEGGK